jgi:hypothetical protein
MDPPFYLLLGFSAALDPSLDCRLYYGKQIFGNVWNSYCELLLSDPGIDKISAPIVRLKNSTSHLAYPSAVLLQAEQMQDFFLRCII